MKTFGWALLDDETCSFVDLGVVIAPMDDDAPVTLDRARRCVPQANVLAERMPGVHVVVAERMSFPPGAGMKAAVPIALSWGVVIGVRAMCNPRPRLMTIAPQRWQREVLPNAGREVDYATLARTAATYILANHPAAAKALLAIKCTHPRGHKQNEICPDRFHAIDAAMIALVGTLRPHRCDVVEEGRIAS